PNSAARWQYAGCDQNADGRLEFEETFHRTLAMPAIKDGLLVITDLAGLVHCLDAETGKVHWTYDMLAAVWAGPLVADGKVFVADEDGDVCVFALSAEPKLLAENNMEESVYGTPVAVDDTLYIATTSHLVAIGKTGGEEDKAGAAETQ
ncbi:MAG: PQQ-binding-like beta-propeller repeat protein, partial [candidate division WOR-3 bacterium]